MLAKLDWTSVKQQVFSDKFKLTQQLLVAAAVFLDLK
jgi:hypothetical protein